MAYKSLYRRYRPTNFDEVVGQKYIIQTIKNSIMNEKIGHAYLFSGPRGIGKTTIARIIAKAVNCPNTEDANPCNNCVACKSINDGSSIDVIEIDAASNNGVDEMRNLLEKVNFLPGSFKYKIYIIDEVHMLSISAFNALLKTLEEPPMHVIFILATTEPHKVPATILSRCQRFDFKPLNVNEIKTQLTKVKELENINITEEAIEVIAEAAEGGMRDALSILDQVSAYGETEIDVDSINNITGRVSTNDILKLVKLINEVKVSDALDAANDILNKGKEVSTLIQAMLSICRDFILYQNARNNLSNKVIFQNEVFISLANTIKKGKLFKYVDVLNDIQNKIKYTNSPKIYLEVGIVKMVSSESTSQTVQISEDIDLSEIYDKIYALESLVNQVLQSKETDDLGEFKDFTKSKLEFLEEVVSRCAVPPRDLEERIELLEEQATPDELENRIKLLENKVFNEQTVVEQEVVPQANNEELINRVNLLSDELHSYINQRNEVPGVVEAENNYFGESSERIDELSGRVEDILLQLEAYQNIFVTNDVLNNRLANLSVEPEEVPTVDLGNIYNRLEILEKEITNYHIPIQESSNETLEVEKFNIENEDLFNTYDDSYQDVSELDKVKENYLVLFNKVMDLQKDVVAQKEDLEKHIAKFSELSEYISTIPTNLIDENTIKELETQIQNVKEYSIKVGSRCTALEEAMKNIKVEAETKPTTIQRRPQPFDTPLREEQQVREQTITPVVETEEAVEEKTTLPEGHVDVTARVYDIKVIENILHQSRDRKNMDDKDKINAVWNRLASLVPQNLSSIATTLSEGKVVVNGANYFIIVYSKASICNHLMTEQNHYLAKEVLRITLQKEYDFIALPINTWHEKSTEYKGQYHMGIRYPSLTPIDNPELKVINVTKTPFQTQGTQNYNKAAQLFGKSLIREVK